MRVCVGGGGGGGGEESRDGIEVVVWSIVFCRTRVISAVTRRPTQIGLTKQTCSHLQHGPLPLHRARGRDSIQEDVSRFA